MKDQWQNGIVPPQTTGQSSDTITQVKCQNNYLLMQRYQEAAGRLFDVNRWHEFAGKGTAKFTLINNQGNPLKRRAQKDDYIRIRLPAPDNPTGEGDDWVQVQQVLETTINKRLLAALTVRPAEDPVKSAGKTAHFFTTTATSTFMIYSDGLTLTAAVYGRNEHPNTNSNGLLTRLRNWIIFIGAQLGLSKAQWKLLTRGLLSK